MRRYCLITALIVAGCFSLLGCRQEAKPPAVVEEEPKPKLAPPKEVAPPKPVAPPVVKKPTPKKKPAPKIVFEKEVYDFGRIGPNTRSKCTFKFRNAGDALLKIEKIQSTCGCTIPELKKKEYAPGESGTIEVVYRASNYPSKISKRLYVHGNDKSNPKLALTMKAEIVLKVSYEPKKLSLMHKRENAGCPPITLKSLDNQPFAIRAFTSTRNAITADFNPSTQVTKFLLRPKVDLNKLREGLSGRVTISLTHPECNKVTIPFSVLRKFRINPPSIIIYNAVPEKTVTRKVWILNNYDEEFEIESVSTEKDIIKVLKKEKVESKQGSGSRYVFDLQITPPPRENKTGFTDVLHVTTKKGEKLQVRCNGFYSRKTKKPSKP